MLFWQEKTHLHVSTQVSPFLFVLTIQHPIRKIASSMLTFCSCGYLSLYTSGSIAASQGLNFFSGYQVEVAGDGVL